MPLDGPLHMGMGDQRVQLAAGDLLVVDNLKLHNVEDFPGLNRGAVSIWATILRRLWNFFEKVAQRTPSPVLPAGSDFILTCLVNRQSSYGRA